MSRFSPGIVDGMAMAFERDRFEEEYNRRRAKWAADLPMDARQSEFF
ncbi:hypothetical protein AAAK29_28090 [Mesorhizobium sp. CCNWLW179-1]|nr:hypothetical protein [Mesorhizobium zhangyense]